MITVNLIIDGNYVLSKNVFSLHKNNVLYGSLEKSLNVTISNYKRLFPFSNVYLVSDSKAKSWRKTMFGEYKQHRKKDSDIDWQFVYETYDRFKQSVTGIKVCEADTVEGDDWIYYLTKKSNELGKSTFIVTNDYDIKQLLKFDLNNNWINIMSNEMMNKEKLFMPKNYKVFLNKASKIDDMDIFNLNNDSEFITLLDKLEFRSEVIEVDPVESLFVKVISGDTSDNIKSTFQSKDKNGKVRGIGDAGAKTIYETYLTEFGEVNFNDVDLYDNIGDLICEKKKISKTNIDKIKSNIDHNMKLISLDMIPDNIIKIMEDKFNQ